LKPKIHPKYYPESRVICGCGNTFTTGSTVPEIRTDVCSACHPFFTGEHRIVDTAGQVERFMRRLEMRDEELSSRKQRRGKKRRKKIIETAVEQPEVAALQDAMANAKDQAAAAQ
jgi:large subunit ribosomal protein L31